MASNDWADSDELAQMGRPAGVLQSMGYDPEEVRANPAMRAEVTGRLQSPYALTQGPGMSGQGAVSPAARAAALPSQVAGAMRAAPPAQTTATTPNALPQPSQQSAQTSPSGKTTTPQSMAGGTPGLDEIGAQALNKGLQLGGFAEQTARDMAASTGPDTTDLEAQRAKDALPTPYRDPNTGKVLDSARQAGYKPGIGTEILRGVRGALVGTLTGGIPGGIIGAIEPQDIRGGTAYGAPDRAYQTTEQTREARLGSEDQQITNLRDQFKAQTDARAKAAQEARQGVTAYNDVAKGASELENSSTNAAKNDTQLRKAGFKTDAQGGIVPLDRSEMSEGQQAMADLSAAREEAAEAQAALNRAKDDPSSPIFKQAQGRLQVAQQNAQTAIQRLGLSNEEFLMHSRGTDAGGNALPGAMELPDNTPVGTAFQGNVRPTGTQRDAAGRATTMNALSDRIEQGLNDPEIQKYMGPAGGRIAELEGRAGTLPAKVAEFRNDLVSYGAFQAGLHPVRGIGALHYFDQVMGGLGQTPEELRGKLASNRNTGQSVQGVGQPHVAGAPATSPQVAPSGSGWAAQFPEAQ